MIDLKEKPGKKSKDENIDKNFIKDKTKCIDVFGVITAYGKSKIII